MAALSPVGPPPARVSPAGTTTSIVGSSRPSSRRTSSNSAPRRRTPSSLAANTLYYRDLLDTYTLFGDPATRLNVLPVDVQIEKQTLGGQTGFTSGHPITYTLTYANAGPATAHHVTITDTLPTALNAVSWTSSGSVITARVGSTYAWDVEDLPAGTGGVITVTGTISEVYQGYVTQHG